MIWVWNLIALVVIVAGANWIIRTANRQRSTSNTVGGVTIMRHTTAVIASLGLFTLGFITLGLAAFIRREQEGSHMNLHIGMAIISAVFLAVLWKVANTRYGFDDSTLSIRNWGRSAVVPFSAIETVRFSTFADPNLRIRTSDASYRISCYVNSLSEFARAILERAPQSIRDDRTRVTLMEAAVGRLPNVFDGVNIPDRSD